MFPYGYRPLDTQEIEAQSAIQRFDKDQASHTEPDSVSTHVVTAPIEGDSDSAGTGEQVEQLCLAHYPRRAFLFEASHNP